MTKCHSSEEINKWGKDKYKINKHNYMDNTKKKDSWDCEECEKNFECKCVNLNHFLLTRSWGFWW